MSTASDSTRQAIKTIRQEAQPIPGRDWRFHPAVPISLITRHPIAQRPSPIAILRKKGKYDANKAGLPRLVPNGAMFYAVTGATRTEWASENSQATMPAEIWPQEMSPKGMAAFFLDELEHVEPSTAIKQKLGEVAEQPIAIAVRAAVAQLPGTKIIGAFRVIYGKKNGPLLLQKTVAQLKKTWPRAIPTISASVVNGMSILLDSGGAVAHKWKSLGPEMLLQRARTRQAHHGGKGNLSSHVATLLKMSTRPRGK